MLSLNDVACRRDGTLLFEHASLIVHAGQKVGLTGANGTGKSSLFAMIRGTLEPDHGEISLPRQVGITHVAQETPGSARSALDHVVDGDERVRALEAAIAGCGETDGVRHAALLGELEEAGGWSTRARAGALLNGLGFDETVHEAPVSSFSGGWRMRLNLAQALISPNELLLLDEPTNHLDLDAVLWLEEWLRRREGTLLLISHDREFLDAVTDHTLHIERGTVTLATGGYSAFERQRAARLASQQASHEKHEARRRELQGFVDRFRAKASKARQAQSRLKMLERMGESEAVRPDSPFRFAFRKPRASPSPLVILEKATVDYGDGPVLEKVDFSVQAGERIGLLGANGAGKSTLVKTLVGELTLAHGTRVPARKLSVGYFAQHQVDRLRNDRSPLEALLADAPHLSDAEARTFLGGFGFQGERAMQKAATLSGGERARLALALIVHARPNLLLLDEPTNHLDIDMRQALADALQAFEGALLVISHDRVMLRTVVDELWLVSERDVRAFDDDLDGYARWLAARRGDTGTVARAARGEDGRGVAKAGPNASARTKGRTCGANGNGTVSGTANEVSDEEGQRDGAATADAGARRDRRRAEAEHRGRLAPFRREVERAERALVGASERLGDLRTRLAEPGLYNDEHKASLAELLEQEGDARRAVESIEESLLEAMERLELAETGRVAPVATSKTSATANAIATEAGDPAP